MGSLSAMSSIERVIERHGETIRQTLISQLAEQTDGLVDDVNLENNMYEINVIAVLSNGRTLELRQSISMHLAETIRTARSDMKRNLPQDHEQISER